MKPLNVNIEDENFVMQLIDNLLMKYDSLVEAIEESMTNEKTIKLQLREFEKGLGQGSGVEQ